MNDVFQLYGVILVIFCVQIKVMVVLLEEDQAERKSLRELNTQTESLTFSSGSLQLSTKLSFLHGSHILLL